MQSLLSPDSLVDPELAVALDRPRIVLSDETLSEARSRLAQGLALLAADRPDPTTEIDVEEWIAPGLNGPPVKVKLFRPAGKRDALPAFLHIHGGGYVFGGSPFFDHACKHLAADTVCAVASVDYRVAPETPAPGALEDCYSALRWLHTRSSTLGIDPSRIAVGGESAGGGLAATLALLARDRGEVSIRMQCLTYPMLDDRTVMRTDLNPFVGHQGWSREQNHYGWSAWLGTKPGSEDVPAYAAAARAPDLQGLPPTFILVGALDLFLDECLDYGQRLLRAGVATELHVYPGAFHGFDAYVPEAMISRSARRARIDAIRRALGS